MIRLKNILQEKSNDSKKAFQKIAFGDPASDDELEVQILHQTIANLQGKEPTEEDTEEEKRILSYFEDWTNAASGRTASALYGEKSLFKQATKDFPEIFRPATPIGTPVYRLLTLLPKVLMEKIRKAKIEDFEIIHLPQNMSDDVVFYKYKKPIQYSPHRLVQSWTSEKGVLRAMPDGCVLCSIQDEDYMMNQNFMSAVYSSQVPDSDEHEMLHFNKSYKNKIYLAIPEDTFVEIRSDDFYTGIE